MDRRKVLKMTALATLGAVVSANAQTMSIEQMNRLDMKPKDPKNMTEAELKHSPEILIKDKDAKGYTLVEISVGQKGIIHPSTPEHWIDFISLHADDKLVAKSTLEAEISRGATAFRVKLDNVKILTAKAGCNLHGIWSTNISL